MSLFSHPANLQIRIKFKFRYTSNLCFVKPVVTTMWFQKDLVVMQLGEEWIFQSDVKSPKGYLVACSFFKISFPCRAGCLCWRRGGGGAGLWAGARRFVLNESLLIRRFVLVIYDYLSLFLKRENKSRHHSEMISLAATHPPAPGHQHSARIIRRIILMSRVAAH